MVFCQPSYSSNFSEQNWYIYQSLLFVLWLLVSLIPADIPLETDDTEATACDESRSSLVVGDDITVSHP